MTEQPPKTKAAIVRDIRALAEACLDTGTDAEYYGGLDADMIRAARVLCYSSAALVLLVDSLEAA